MRKSITGFALIEVLIAVTIVGIALPALMLRMQSIVNTTAYIEDRTVAYWIAENKLQELSIDQQLGAQASRASRASDVLTYGDREWRWSYEIEEVPLPDILRPAKMFRVDIVVGHEETEQLAALSGFLHESP